MNLALSRHQSIQRCLFPADYCPIVGSSRNVTALDLSPEQATPGFKPDKTSILGATRRVHDSGKDRYDPPFSQVFNPREVISQDVSVVDATSGYTRLPTADEVLKVSPFEVLFCAI